MATDVPGTLYLLHFDPPYKHARHYLGWSRDVEQRFERHLAGAGSPLVKAAVAAGCEVVLVWTREGTRNDERRHKAGKNVPKLCDLCRAS